jgi:hypothetical protein
VYLDRRSMGDSAVGDHALVHTADPREKKHGS